MKFIETIKEQIQPEWTDFYINYTLLLQILSPLRSSYKSELKLNLSFSKKPNLLSPPSKHQPHSSSKQLIDNDLHEPLLSIPEEDENYLNTSDELITITKKKFFTQLKIEVDKFNFFVQETHNNRHKKRMTSIIEQLSYIKRNKEYKMFNDELEKIIAQRRDAAEFLQKNIDKQKRKERKTWEGLYTRKTPTKKEKIEKDRKKYSRHYED